MFYFCLAYGISWLLWLPLVAAALGWIGPVSRYWHLVGSLGPALAAFIFAGLLEGRTAVRRLYNGMVKWRINESYQQMGVVGATGWYLSMLTGSILLTWLYNSSDGSILLLAIFHGLLDLVMVNQAVGPVKCGFETVVLAHTLSDWLPLLFFSGT